MFKSFKYLLHDGRRSLLYFMIFCLLIVSYSRGYVNDLSKWGEPYWVINYHDGLLRRTLVGEIFSWFFNQNNISQLRPVVLYIHLISCLILSAALLAWVRIQNLRTESSFIILIFTLFIGSQFLPRLAHDTGYLDIYVYGLVLASLAFASIQVFIPIILIGIIGPFLNEGFLFVWMTFSILLLWKRFSIGHLLICLVPSISAFILYFFNSESAALAQMAAAPLSPDVKAMMLEYQFGHTLSRTAYIMQWKFKYHFENFLVALIFYTYPSAVMCLAYGVASRNLRDSLALTLATFAPLTVLMLGWDLSRFLLISSFSGLVSILYMSTIKPIQKTPLSMAIVCLLASSFSFVTPHIYAFFNVAGIADKGLLPLSKSQLASGINKITDWYTWGNDDFRPNPQLVASDPPGTVWHVEEEAWIDTWTRRPGTNVFDVEATLGLATIRFKVTVIQIGDIIKVSRIMGDGTEMIYSGRISGRTVSGRYPGGVWIAKID